MDLLHLSRLKLLLLFSKKRTVLMPKQSCKRITNAAHWLNVLWSVFCFVGVLFLSCFHGLNRPNNKQKIAFLFQWLPFCLSKIHLVCSFLCACWLVNTQWLSWLSTEFVGLTTHALACSHSQTRSFFYSLTSRWFLLISFPARFSFSKLLISIVW